MSINLGSHTYGTHAYMKLRLDSGRIEEIDVYFRADGETYRTSADHSSPAIRQEIIEAFKALY